MEEHTKKTLKQRQRKQSYHITRKAKNQLPPDFITPEDNQWMPQSNVKFMEWITNLFQPYETERIIEYYNRLCPVDDLACASHTEEELSSLKLLNQQRFIRDYISYNSPYRGIIVYHGLGSGKTLASIAAAETFRIQSQNAETWSTTQPNIVVILPASLESNYINEIKKWSFPYFHKMQKWAFQSVTGSDEIPQEIVEIIGLSFIKKHKGYWKPDSEHGRMPKADAESPMTTEQIQFLDKQLDVTIRHFFTFLHYNGIRRPFVSSLIEKDFFSNKFVIIDEAHKFVSGMINKSNKVSPLLYEALLNARNIRILALSGTPVTNHPVEIGAMLSMVKGLLRDFTFYLTPNETTVWNSNEIREMLQSITLEGINNIDQLLRIDNNKRTVSLTLHPDFFVNGFDGKIYRNNELNQRMDLVIEQIIHQFAQHGYTTEQPDITQYKLFPESREEFESLFNVTHENTELFLQRSQGLVSFFKTSSAYADNYPTVKNNFLIKATMSGMQVEQYMNVRTKEHEEEARNRLQTENINNDKQATTYKMRSRQVCNFAFPESVARPKASIKVVSEIDADEYGEEEREQLQQTQTKQQAYLQDKRRAIEQLSSHADGKHHLRYSPDIASVVDTLGLLSPKYYYMYENIRKSPGKVFVYSTFKQLEGIELFAESLKQNGWSPIEIKNGLIVNMDEALLSPYRYMVYSGDETKEEKELIISIYNGRLSEISNEKLVSQLMKLKNRSLKLLYGIKIDKHNHYVGDNLQHCYLTRLQKELAEVTTLWGDHPKIVKRQTRILTQEIAQLQLQRDYYKSLYSLDGDHARGYEVDHNLYGGIMRGFLATSSAAEGITLKCVRQVHIMEPYWNPVRIEQVIGRAVRFESHIDLPKGERDVDIYMYLSIFSEKDKEENTTIKVQENGMTSDENLHAILSRKDKLNDFFLQMLKQVAVDCRMNKTNNSTEEEPISCYVPRVITGDGLLSKYNYVPNIVQHEQLLSNNVTRKESPHYMMIELPSGVEENVWYVPKTGRLYRKKSSSKRRKLLGVIKKDKEGKEKIRWMV